ncbi:MAG: Fur family transcriptional regulator [Actinomycetota bacterium]|nr:Fur family transcriptional regulator [Actinomycetota bacterium]
MTLTAGAGHASADRVLERTIKAIHAHGGRVTPARLAVISAIVDSEGHVSAEEIFERIQAGSPDIHLSTVYRTLEALEKLGVVEHVHLGHGRAIYHLEENLHQHLVCESCGKIIEAPRDLTERLEMELEARLGFYTRAHHFSIIGLCRDCHRREQGGGTKNPT